MAEREQTDQEAYEAEARRRLRLAARRLARAEAERDEAICAARAVGLSYRAIGDEVGMSHPGVIKVLGREHPAVESAP